MRGNLKRECKENSMKVKQLFAILDKTHHEDVDERNRLHARLLDTQEYRVAGFEFQLNRREYASTPITNRRTFYYIEDVFLHNGKVPQFELAIDTNRGFQTPKNAAKYIDALLEEFLNDMVIAYDLYHSAFERG